MNIFLASTDSSAITIVWAMTALVENSKVMKKVQAEIRESVGKKGIVNEEDIKNMPYLKAVIKETFRLYPPAPLLVARETMQNSMLEGYKIPPKTMIHVNYWAIARDPEYWENPEHFIPERFLNSSIDFKGQDFEFISFGAGRRICPGIALGITMVELILSNLIYAFDWELPFGTNIEDIDMTKKKGVCLVPKNYM